MRNHQGRTNRSRAEIRRSHRYSESRLPATTIHYPRAIVKVPAELPTDRDEEAASGVYARELEVYNLLRDMQSRFQPRIFAALYDSGFADNRTVDGRSG